MAAFFGKIKDSSAAIICAVLFMLCCMNMAAQRIDLKRTFRDAGEQYKILLHNISEVKNTAGGFIMPRTVEGGELKLVKSSDWTSGFFPGALWYIFMYNQQSEWREKADSFTRLLEKEKFNDRTHDMGFKIFCSFGNAYKATKNEYYKNVVIEAANTLSTRFNKKVGAIRSWDHSRDKWDFPVIIDNMMNLELLFAATKYTGDSSFYKIAVQHANTTLKHHYRPDFSSYHVIDFDTLTGNVIKKNTHQGYSHESAWTRGQAWGLYGFAMCYEETRITDYLKQAEAIANFMIRHPAMPVDMVPYWDFDDPGIPNAVRDASAATVMASALLKLSKYSKQKRLYKRIARKILSNLTKYYRSPVGSNKGFILMHSTGHLPANSEVDVPINYADYYYLEGLLQIRK